MLKQHWRAVSKFERAGDNIVILLAFFLAYYFRGAILVAENNLFHSFPQQLSVLGPLKDYIVVLFIGLALYNAVLTNLGAYRSMRLSTLWSLLKIVFSASAVVFLCAAAFLYMLKVDLSRSFVGIFCGMSGVFLLIERYATLQALRLFRIQGKNFRNVLVVGTGAQARKLYLEVIAQPELGIRVRGFVALKNKVEDRNYSEIESGCVVNAGCVAKRNTSFYSNGGSSVYDLPTRIIANVDSYESVLKQYAVDEVLFTDVVENFSIIRDMAQIAVEEGIGVNLAADFFSLEILRSEISSLGSTPLVHFEPSLASEGALVIKRLLDITLSAVALVLLSPVMLATALSIRFNSVGSVFFRQQRVGLNGRIFTLLKFRSMVDNAESMLKDLIPFNEMTGPAFKMAEDPRVTGVGWIIRRYSIDELPQLINVLKGDMSLVGPRPPIPDEVVEYNRKQRRRLSMRPGITCTWQVSGRNEINDFATWAQMDLEYIDKWSLLNDMILLIKTIPAVFRASGAR